MQTTIASLGPCEIRSPLAHGEGAGAHFRTDADRVLWDDTLVSVESALKNGQIPPSLEVAGPRERIFFDPSRTTAGIVTCGGLCPGLNDVIRGLVMQLYHRYGVKKIVGFRYGYEGLIPSYGHAAMMLHPDNVANIHKFGGTLLGSSRGHQDISVMADTLERMGVDILFVIGGDGTLRGASLLSLELLRRGLNKAVVGIPKTIDNDIVGLDKCFGFETAVAEAEKVITCAHIEAVGAVNGIGLVKLMGRDSGFIASLSALACSEVNFVLIPEVPFRLEGEQGLLACIERRLAGRHHAVIAVAEGAGQDLLSGTGADASGNQRYGDIGIFLKDKISAHFKAKGVETSIKYIDPSYTIRSVPAGPQDNVYCSILAQHAVHAAMAGKTGTLIVRWHGRYVHIPIDLVTQGRRKVDPQGELWQSVLENTGQPRRFE
jgi:6-phosphofructokinase 1